jgi:hypothetical protein
MEQICYQKIGSKLEVGTCPKLVIDLESGENYIETEERKIPYHKNIWISEDLLQGKRANVMQTAMNHYYMQARDVAEGYRILDERREKLQKAHTEK